MTPEERARPVVEEIIKECFRRDVDGSMGIYDLDALDILAAAIREAVEAEREACAKIVDDFALGEIPTEDEWCSKQDIAKAIRARGKK